MGLQPPILEDVSSQSIRRLLVWKLVNTKCTMPLEHLPANLRR